MATTAIRLRIKKKIEDLLKKDHKNYVTLAKEIEENIFVKSQATISKTTDSTKATLRTAKLMYYSLARQIYNLLNKCSYVYKDDVIKPSFPVSALVDICSVPFTDFRPHKWKALQKDIEILNERYENRKNVQTTDQFECPSCHKRKCTYTEAQTRSADEPMTIFVQCQNCGKEFRR